MMTHAFIVIAVTRLPVSEQPSARNIHLRVQEGTFALTDPAQKHQVMCLMPAGRSHDFE